MLLRAGVEFFSNWGMELLVTQLHDHSKAVSMEALDILDEACEDKVIKNTCLHQLTDSIVMVLHCRTQMNFDSFKQRKVLFCFFA